VRSLARVARSLPRPRRSRPEAAIDALDVLITAGRSAPQPVLEQRVVKQLARMLHARVLFHRSGGRTIQQEDQQIHTLSSWTLHELARSQYVRARRIRPRPEYWLPEQRRPGGVLAFPLEEGVACLGRSAPFTSREVGAVRTVLRFMAAQRGPADAPPSAPPPEQVQVTQAPPRVKGLIGSSRPWKRVLEQVWKLAPTRCSVLLLGESGTGKELLARAFHLASERAQGPFIAVNCAAINAETMLSELFGHIRGAFTGALRSRRGLIRRAHGGTLFLDEVGDMPPDMQMALLRVLQERLVRPVGSSREHAVDVRVLSATNRDLDALVRSGRFRKDLYHRLNVVSLRVPALRERLTDLAELSHHILERLEEPKTLHMDALPLLARYSWPGNVRELDNVLQASALLSDGPVVSPEVLAQALQGRERPRAPGTDRLPARAAQIMERLTKRWTSAPNLAEQLGVSTRTVNRELVALVDSGLVMADGQARARRYRAS
jgi:transcriptional regulator of acetoin/glycerol metabolism